MSVDWPATLVRAKANAGQWVLAGTRVPASSMTTLKRRSNHALRALEHPIEGKVTNRVGTPARGDLYVRYLGPVEKPSQEPAFFRTVVVNARLKDRLVQIAADRGTTITGLVEKACTDIAKRGARGLVTNETTTLNVTPDEEIWRKALARAQADGFVMAEAIRAELGRLG